MIDNSELYIADWEYEIIYSNTVNIYSNQFIIKPIWWFELLFEFIKDSTHSENKIQITWDDENKRLRIVLTNFWTTLWTGTTNKISIMTIWEWDTKKEVFFSLFWSSLNETTTLLQVTLSLYVR